MSCFLAKYYSSGNVRDSEVGLACDSSCGEDKFVHFLVERPEGKIKRGRPLGRKLTLKLFLSFRRVVNVIYSFLGNSPASEI